VKPVTIPEGDTAAVDGMLLVHAPPLTESVNVAGVPTQITEGPEMLPA
jgi:hypothetical protein